MHKQAAKHKNTPEKNRYLKVPRAIIRWLAAPFVVCDKGRGITCTQKTLSPDDEEEK